ncbi:hypothetical protein [Pusillimonas caeni]|uniref:hypothetical protein n=1 Tax=Pusillimonas caeni TaxID=1348472 RepID=UPI001432131B|nr:hypothetical protein [Pusillimonas caeni]
MNSLQVPFTSQQMVLLKMLYDESGRTDGLDAMILEMFRSFARQTLGRDCK